MTSRRCTEQKVFDRQLTHQVGAPDADVHDVSDAFPTEAFPLAAADSL